MSDREVPEFNWGTRLIEGFLYPFAISATPVMLLSLLGYLVTKAFTVDLNSGVRSFASVMLPLMTVTYLIKYRRESLSGAGRAPNWAAFSVMLAFGLLAMRVLSLSTSVPAAELVLSGSFAVLVFSYVVLPRDKMIAYYFGAILGSLAYVVLWGFPRL